MITTIRVILISILFLVLVQFGLSQFKEDAYRLSYLGLGVGARSLGLGTSYTGIANDFSAIYWNPAGLAQIRTNEFSMGLSHFSYGSENNFLGNKEKFTNSTTNLNSFGLVYPFPVAKGSLVFALGYARQVDFTTAIALKGFNPSPKGVTFAEYPDSIDIDTKVLENGGLNNWIVAGALEAAKGFYLGVSLNFISGTYTYNRDYTGNDVDNLYKFYQINRKYNINEDIGGFTGRMGLLYETRNRQGRFGVSIKFPSYFSLRDDWSDILNYYDDLPDSDFVSNDGGYSEFDLTTPYVFSAGFSWIFNDLLFSGNIDYTDWTQMEFRNTYSDLLDENTIIKLDMEPTTNVRVGAEYSIPTTDLQVRAGFAYLPSPFKFHTKTNAQKYVTAGLGWLIDNSIKLDLGYAYGFWDINHEVNADPGYFSIVSNEKIHTNTLIATVLYRF